jgi:hypothetical protein
MERAIGAISSADYYSRQRTLINQASTPNRGPSTRSWPCKGDAEKTKEMNDALSRQRSALDDKRTEEQTKVNAREREETDKTAVTETRLHTEEDLKALRSRPPAPASSPRSVPRRNRATANP